MLLPVAMTSLFISPEQEGLYGTGGTRSEVLENVSGGEEYGAHARIIRLSITCQLVGRGSSTLQRPRAE